MIVVGFFETMPCITLTSVFDFSQAYGRSKKNKTYICKPETGCQGKGIFVTKNLKDIRPYEHIVCQQYISKVRSILLGYLPFSTPSRRSDLWEACANPSSKIWGWISSPPHNATRKFQMGWTLTCMLFRDFESHPGSWVKDSSFGPANE